MRTPDSLIALVDHGIIDSVQRPLMSGKEAQIYLVESGGEPRVAKIYKEAQNRSFQNRADYTEGRKVRNSRDQRAMSSRSKHGRAQNEAAWKSAEVDMIYRLREAGVRVPTPFNFIDGVLIMELVTDADGFPAPRLGDLTFEPDEATEIFHKVLAEVVRMLCAGVVHGDLSDFNVLMDANGPVVIDFPQAVDASSNANARKLLLRDVDNLHRFHAKWAPEVPALPYAQEMWELYSRNALTPDTRLTGKFRTKEKAVSTRAVLDLIADAEHDERRRREGLGLSMRGARPVDAGARPTDLPVTRDDRGRGEKSGPPARAQAPGREPQRSEPSARRERPAQEPRQQQAPRGEPVQREERRQAPRFEQQAPRNERPAQQQTPRFDRQAPRNERPAREAPRFDRQAPRSERPAREAPRFEQQAPRAERPARETPRFEQQGPRAERPAQQPRFDPQAPRAERPRFEQQAPRGERSAQQPRFDPQAPRSERPAQQPRFERPAPRNEHAAQPRFERPAPRNERPAQRAPQVEQQAPRNERHAQQAPRFEPQAPRNERHAQGRGEPRRENPWQAHRNAQAPRDAASSGTERAAQRSAPSQRDEGSDALTKREREPR